MRTKTQNGRQLSASMRHMLRCRRGAAAVEFAAAAPLFLLLMVGMLEFGYYMHQADTLEKSLRSGAMYAARSTISNNSFTAAVETEIENIVKTGDKDGTSDLLLQGWHNCVNCLNIQILNRSVSENGENVSVDVVRLRAAVPYDPVVVGLLELIGFSNLMMRFQHEQAHFQG